MDLGEAKRRVCSRVDRMGAEIVGVSREIHAHPELAFEEHRAARTVATALEKAGIDVRRGVYGLETALRADIGGPGPCVAILAEYDALPEIGHACGHNVIAAAAFGAVVALCEPGIALPGCVRFLGTPAEEKGGGKERMARAGAFEDVDAAMMVHPGGINLATMPCLAVAEVEVVYRGTPAHASAMAHRGVNALDALVLAYQSIAALRQHIQASERVHGIITDGGSAPNVVPDRAAAVFYVRAANRADLDALTRRVDDCFRAGATATGATVDVRWAEVRYLDLRRNAPLEEAFQTNAEGLGRSFLPVDLLPTSARGSTDMGNVSQRVPSIHPMIAAAPPACTIHHPEFAKWAGSQSGDQAALHGAKALAMTVLDFLSDASLRARAREEFERHGPPLS